MYTHSDPAEPEISMLPDGWVTLPFDECALPVKPKPSIQQNQYRAAGRFPVVDQGAKLIAGYTDDPSGVHADTLPLILFGDHTRVFKFLDFPFAAGADGTKLLQANERRVDALFLYYALRSLEVPSRGYNRHFADLKGMTLTIPARIHDQRAIASVLAAIEAAADIQVKRTTILKDLFTATLRTLMTGQIRIPVTN
jgi:type I restriction enzyme S subunit